MRSGSKQVGKRTSVISVNFQSIRNRTLIAPTISTGCLRISLLTAVKAICTTRVSLVIREIKKPERILLKKSIERRTILLKSWPRMSVTTLLLTHCMQYVFPYEQRLRTVIIAGIARQIRTIELIFGPLSKTPKFECKAIGLGAAP